MADFNFTELRRDLIPAGTWGNVNVVLGAYTADTNENTTDRIALCKVPGNALILGFAYTIGDMGTAQTFDLGVEAEDGLPTAPTSLATAIAEATAAVVWIPGGLATVEDSYIFATLGGADITVAGDIDITVFYRYDNA